MGRDRPTQLPGLAMVIAVKDVRMLRRFPFHFFAVITRDDEPPLVGTVLHLDTDSGPRGIPGPVWLLHPLGDVSWFGPGAAIVAAVRDKHVLVIPAKGQPDRLGDLIHHWAGIANRDFGGAAFFVDDLQGAPGLACVMAALQEE